LVLVQSTTLSYLFPYTTLFRSPFTRNVNAGCEPGEQSASFPPLTHTDTFPLGGRGGVTDHFTFFVETKLEWRDADSIPVTIRFRSEEHTSELQSRENLVCRLLL